MNIRPLEADEARRVIAAGLGLSRLPRGDGSFYLVTWEGDEPVGHAHLALAERAVHEAAVDFPACRSS